MNDKKTSDRILDVHMLVRVNQEIPAAIARIADETCQLWPEANAKDVIAAIARSIGAAYANNPGHWRTVAAAAENKCMTLHRTVRL